MILVVDASVASKWFIPEELSDAADRLLASDHELAAPDLLLVEAGNILWKKARLGEISPADAGAVLADLAGGVLTLRPSAPLASRALAIAHELDHPVHDCLYLALAEAEGGTVVTADRRFLRQAVKGRWGQRIASVEDVRAR